MPASVVDASIGERQVSRELRMGLQAAVAAFLWELRKDNFAADIGGLVWALTRLARETGICDWTNRIYFLQR